LAILAAVAGPAMGEDQPAPESFSLHGQFTGVAQGQWAHSPLRRGEQSPRPLTTQKETADFTLFLGMRLWQGGEFYLNPEVGFRNAVGLASFPIDEHSKTEKNRPDMRLGRAFLRQVIALEGDSEDVEAGPNALAGRIAKNNVTLTIGRFGVDDIFDGNTYAHDARADFVSWPIVEAGTFDFASDAWGYTHGAAVEWQTGDWSLRLGIFAMPEEPGSGRIDNSFGQRSWVAEIERRYEVLGRPGQARLIGYRNQARMGRYDEAVRRAEGTGANPDTGEDRRWNRKRGWALNVEQELAPAVGAFFRLSASDDRVEVFSAMDMNRSVSGGVALKGSLWSQPTHTWGMAVAVNGLSGDAIRYFNAGGMGQRGADDPLPTYGREQVLETYYSIRSPAGLTWTGILQRIGNPAYNRDCGAATLVGVRLHAEF
jgi:high affinity Mn2+ porin